MAFALSHTLVLTSGTVAPPTPTPPCLKTSGTRKINATLSSFKNKLKTFLFPKYFSSATLYFTPINQAVSLSLSLCLSVCLSLSVLQKQTEDISLPQMFQFSNTVLHPYQSGSFSLCLCLCLSPSLSLSEWGRDRRRRTDRQRTKYTTTTNTNNKKERALACITGGPVRQTNGRPVHAARGVSHPRVLPPSP